MEEEKYDTNGIPYSKGNRGERRRALRRIRKFEKRKK